MYPRWERRILRAEELKACDGIKKKDP